MVEGIQNGRCFKYKRIRKSYLNYQFEFRSLARNYGILGSFVVELDETHLGLDAVHDILQVFLIGRFFLGFVFVQKLLSLCLLGQSLYFELQLIHLFVLRNRSGPNYCVDFVGFDL